MIFSGLRPLAKIILNASTSKGPVLFFNGTTHAYLENTSMHTSKKRQPSLNFCIDCISTKSVCLPLLVNTVQNHSVSLKMTTYGFMKGVHVLFHQPLFDFRTDYVIFFFFFLTILYKRSMPPNPPERFRS